MLQAARTLRSRGALNGKVLQQSDEIVIETSSKRRVFVSAMESAAHPYTLACILTAVFQERRIKSNIKYNQKG